MTATTRPEGSPALQTYLTRFAQAAAATGVPSDRIGEAVAEIEAHVTDSAEDPREAFGEPTVYAHQLGGTHSPETLWAAVVRLLALLYGAASLGAGLFTLAHRATLTSAPGGRGEDFTGPVIPSDTLAATADGFATVWIPLLIMPGLAALLVATTCASARNATPHPSRRVWWLLFVVFLVVLLWFIPSMLANWQTLGYPTESPWKYQIPPGIIFVAAAAVATIRRRPRPQRIYDPAGQDRTFLARDTAPALLTTACGLLALLAFPLLPLTWF